MADISVIMQFFTGHKYLKLNNHKVGQALGCHIKYRYPMIDGCCAKVNWKTLQKLAGHPAVKVIWRDKTVKAVLDISTPVVNAPPVWNFGFRGNGVGIAVVDTGIYPHPDLTTPVNRIIAFRDFVGRRTRPYDDNGHGTHVAGDAAGNGARSDGLFTGPAPMANLIGVKVLNRNGSGFLSTVLAGIQWCIDNKANFNIRVINLSLGATATQSCQFDPLCQAVGAAWQAGIVVCAAAGNSGPGSGTIITPGINPNIVTVGADDTKRTIPVTDDTIAGFSSRGPTLDGVTKPDVVAPGVNVISLRSPRSTLDRTRPGLRVGNWYFRLSGTSMATPICAGVTSLLIQMNPGISPDIIKNALKSTARNIGNNPPNIQGSGLIDALAAIQSAI